MNNYIVTSFGFIKGISFNKETYVHTIEYTDRIRNAKEFTGKAAKVFMEKHDVIGFIYNPYSEEPLRNMYEVKRQPPRWYDTDSTNEVMEWKAVKAMMAHDTDVSFLNTRKSNRDHLMTLEEAERKALELNQDLAQRLTEKINNLKKSLWKQ